MNKATTIALGLFLSLVALSANKKPKYPVIEAVGGPAMRIDERITVASRKAERSEQERQLRKNEVLKDKAWLRLGERAETRIALHADAILSLSEKTEILIPAIDWQDGGVDEIQLSRGSFRAICKENCGLKVITPLYEGVFSEGDFILRYDTAIPEVELAVLQGETSFRGLENETTLTLKAAQRVRFTGVLEDGEPAYDVLLKGRRVAKGKLGEVQEIPASEVIELQKLEETKKKIVKMPVKSKRLPSQICDKPWGELNQCVWTCENNKKGAKECLVAEAAICVRQRCNANGEWSDRLELSSQGSPCKPKQFVGVCDY